MNIIGVIPARMTSSRFPGKPLAKIHGLPMIGHIYYRSKMSKTLNEVYVATCDKEIYNYIESIGGKAVMTKDTHRSAPDRTAEAVQKVEEETGKKVDVVMMIQGDEPMVRPEMLDGILKPMIEDESLPISNLGLPIKTKEQFEDPNIVKVVVDKDDFALYMSREPIPSYKMGAGAISMQKQTGLISFRRDVLAEFGNMKPMPLELVEKIDMLRLLENGLKVKMAFLDYSLFSVDTKEDLAFVEEKMQGDELMQKYLK
ncbi:MAG: 3-deoxy-manno-octulosonate cytidylyltransferase [Candidatus Nealsonbacteria bacterium]